MRRKIKRKKVNITDPYYNSPSVGKFINHIMRQGKKSVAQKVVYKSFDIIKEKTKGNPLELFDKAVRNVLPSLEVRSRRIGGANYQVPQPVRPERKIQLAFRWIINAAKSKKGKPMAVKLAEELMLAANNEGAAIKKKLDTHRMAEANRAFAHFSW
ncbi:30S ribosomal protein S7 [Candidatus Azambacteria bacterium RIFOXYD1_FULL_42_11]|uniref:Small ribosomal subunit protein uS7 n=4 Tax=Candidatus Azamiibacteriota TaxID=1752741 RepID=A0A0G1BGU1_9BACT|nr:MAG: 30S ribosomal protein S7 [Candidatus Azambacteria bacterium GW2011_GWB1_42_17]KKS45546.1 MAG: 30S ribosomal protein S7 [Candidatus Azambacteria bacterium GW2011_GWA1_42_19]KKS75276.1 MAG: 30S ribosomal protein S7 [Candidatus Azambacteria bacterium GW2011_GWA2_42_9]KKS87784.1 MAG: 30S ribosomal protein S7 [Parcubacteria group bacterium GW2011_GWC1_43_11]OGD42061.1 MAG: 30S ribosomal protein S7 [Candidatus Azambacteria bacterium RIFOXYD1_FULL_42_11]